MIDGLHPYPEMKASGLPWLGGVPAHWETKRIKSVAGIRYGLGQPPETSAIGLPLIRATNVDHGRITKRNLVFVDPSSVPPSRNAFLKAGEIIVVRSGAYTADSAIIPPGYDGAVAGYDMVLSAVGVDPHFLAAAILAPYVQLDQLVPMSMRSAQPHLNAEELGTAIVVLPPRDEQLLIVRFLDWHGARTGKLVRAKRKIIALLNEQKQAIIHRAVTRGLDPNAKLKPSGIPWLGDVPEGWEVKRLKNVCRINPSKLAIKSRAADELATFLPMERVNSDGKIDGSIQAPISDLANGFTYFERGDVILAKITPCFENGKGAVLDGLPTEIGFGSTEFIVLRALREIDPRFLYLLTFEAQFRRLGVESMTGSAGQQRISQEFVANYYIALPGRDEQVRIIESLKAAKREFDAVIDAALREIALIQEFRTRLIADVVTGKLDVRAAASRLPEITEIEPIDDPGEAGALDEASDDTETEEVAA